MYQTAEFSVLHISFRGAQAGCPWRGKAVCLVGFSEAGAGGRLHFAFSKAGTKTGNGQLLS